MTFINLLFGENESILLNPNCSCRLFVDYFRAKCRVKTTDIVDIIDENGWMAELFLKEPQENLLSLFNPRGVYLLAVVELDEEQNVTKITPTLSEWEKKYQFLERKLKHRDKKQAKLAAEATTPEVPATTPNNKEGKLNKKKSQMSKSEGKKDSLSVGNRDMPKKQKSAGKSKKKSKQ